MPPSRGSSPSGRDGLYTPRPLRASGLDARLGQRLLDLEVPQKPCGCRVQVFCRSGRPGYPRKCPGARRCSECPLVPELCEHTLECDHVYPLWEWLQMLVEYDREGHLDPPPPTEPDVAITHEARLALYERRAELGVGLYHPDDVGRLTLDQLSVQAGKGRVELGLVQSRRKKDEAPPPPSATKTIRLWGPGSEEQR